MAYEDEARMIAVGDAQARPAMYPGKAPMLEARRRECECDIGLCQYLRSPPDCRQRPHSSLIRDDAVQLDTGMRREPPSFLLKPRGAAMVGRARRYQRLLHRIECLGWRYHARRLRELMRDCGYLS